MKLRTNVYSILIGHAGCHKRLWIMWPAIDWIKLQYICYSMRRKNHKNKIIYNARQDLLDFSQQCFKMSLSRLKPLWVIIRMVIIVVRHNTLWFPMPCNSYHYLNERTGKLHRNMQAIKSDMQVQLYSTRRKKTEAFERYFLLYTFGTSNRNFLTIRLNM